MVAYPKGVVKITLAAVLTFAASIVAVDMIIFKFHRKFTIRLYI
ncbi:Protein of unknown function [Bacillus wiedmannii]|nr:Protein of unknown function [Bacillus wiedmannii]